MPGDSEEECEHPAQQELPISQLMQFSSPVLGQPNIKHRALNKSSEAT